MRSIEPIFCVLLSIRPCQHSRPSRPSCPYRLLRRRRRCRRLLLSLFSSSPPPISWDFLRLCPSSRRSPIKALPYPVLDCRRRGWLKHSVSTPSAPSAISQECPRHLLSAHNPPWQRVKILLSRAILSYGCHRQGDSYSYLVRSNARVRGFSERACSAKIEFRPHTPVISHVIAQILSHVS